ncbi:MAG: hypothetical protein JWP47_110 [Polaromonas sp.]|jgi:alpha-beta hydrolase superfamily lysophospholipase|nr:hypothetical protein [Polaromonas sp.]
MKRWHFLGAVFTALALLASCSTLDERERTWIFQPSDRSWGGGVAAAEGMEDVWIDFIEQKRGESIRLHGLWLAHAAEDEARGAKPPVLLYLHGARYNVTGSAPRVRRMQELGFSVLAIDYRGFGKSTNELPSEASAYEDARVAWEWLAKKYPDRQRYIFGHSLGGPIAINLASEVSNESGTIVEGTFTSIADVVSTSEWGWMPLSLLITQRFDSMRKVSRIGSPLLVVHGDDDRLILPDLGRKLFKAAAEPKRFVLVPGGSHHNTNQRGMPLYREALAQLMDVK